MHVIAATNNASAESARDRLFISHANPEDNLTTQWLALRLASEGYGVWSDQTDLLGGERFWANIEAAIRERAVRFLLLLSRHSNQRAGVMDELEVAIAVGKQLGIERFVIPLWLDDLPASEFNIRLKSLNAIPFQRWAAGLDELLRLLEHEHIPRSAAFSREAVADWWRSEHAGGVSTEPETLLSNLFPLGPFQLTWTEFDYDFGVATEAATIPFADVPFRMFGRHMVSFLPAELIEDGLPRGVRVKECRAFTYNDGDQTRPPWRFREERQIIAALLNEAWRRLLASRALATHEFTASTAFYFTDGQLPSNRMNVRFPDGGATWRLATGRRGREVDGKTVSAFHWHFAISARATNTPVWVLCVRPHVLFSDDGHTIWESTDRLQRKRRSFCKRWWNDEFRDRNLGAVQFLGSGAVEFTLFDYDGADLLKVKTQPLLFDTPVSYIEDADIPDDPDLLADDEDDVVQPDIGRVSPG